MENVTDNSDTSLVQRLREARDSPAVLKTKLAAIRAHCGDRLVFAFEGIEDKTIYFHWLKHIAPFLSYEFLICNGKAKVLEFRELLRRDLTDLGKLVFFFVDRDFDDLRGFPPGEDLYMTETYSVENHLVSREVLEGVLNVELHCHGEPACRTVVLDMFDQVYAAFLSVTEAHNFRIFLSRTLGIPNLKPWPDKVKFLAKVNLIDVSASEFDLLEVVILSREPSLDEITALKEGFTALDRKERFRGKFAVLFFTRWLQLLGDDRNAVEPLLFKSLEKTSPANGRLPLDSLAAKCTPPQTFRTFIEKILGALPAPPLVAKVG